MNNHLPIALFEFDAIYFPDPKPFEPVQSDPTLITHFQWKDEEIQAVISKY